MIFKYYSKNARIILMYFVYVLKSQKDETIHIGSTGNVEKRVSAHNNGKVSYTKHKKPWRLIYQEEVRDKHRAFQLERFYKTPQGQSILKKKIESQV